MHPIIVAGIIAAAAADDLVLHAPLTHGHLRTSLLVVGGAALFLGGHAIFKALIFRVVPVARLIAVGVLCLLLLVAPYINALTLGIAVLVVILAVAATDRSQHRSAAEVAADADERMSPSMQARAKVPRRRRPSAACAQPMAIEWMAPRSSASTSVAEIGRTRRRADLRRRGRTRRSLRPTAGPVRRRAAIRSAR